MLWGMRGSREHAVKFHPEFRPPLLQCRTKFEWNWDRAPSYAPWRPSMPSFCAAEVPSPYPCGRPGRESRVSGLSAGGPRPHKPAGAQENTEEAGRTDKLWLYPAVPHDGRHNFSLTEHQHTLGTVQKPCVQFFRKLGESELRHVSERGGGLLRRRDPSRILMRGPGRRCSSTKSYLYFGPV